ncbi:hypothetical protein NPIL_464051 [Nephila pilipes]|uniref:Secreted protein n=1 Tax=Nephila pilipes TaxID=299642 RepID=A0A8X6QRM1_NEPPI|nr:hypothetical protein NPIL_464051 [Nephila pilipes]
MIACLLQEAIVVVLGWRGPGLVVQSDVCVINSFSVVCLLPAMVAKKAPKCRHPGAEESFNLGVTLYGTQPQLRPSWSEDVTDVRFRCF